MRKEINLIPLAETGKGSAIVTDSEVMIRTSNISGSLKAWLIGGEAVPIGNIVDGKLHKIINTQNHNGILITQSGRQMLVGHYGEHYEEMEEIPFDSMGFSWQKITGKSFSKANAHLRFILSNKSIYENYKKNRHYFIGESEEGSALALRYSDEENPFGFLGESKIIRNGYAVVCIDKKTGRLYIPDEKK